MGKGLNRPNIGIWKQQFETGAATRLTGHADGPVKPVYQTFHNGQAYAEAGCVDIAAAMEGLESLVKICLVHTAAFITDNNLLAINNDPNHATVGMVDRVAD